MLKTNYKDDLINGLRKYKQTTNSDKTISLEDVSEYTQVGDTFGAKDINQTNQAINKLNNTQTINVPTNWALDSGSNYYVAYISVANVTSSDIPIISLYTNGQNKENTEKMNNEYNKISRIETYNGGLAIFAKTQTTIEITLLIKGV